ncbi:hypothetical protein DdX_06633 [Ditylenchus destructor]|uniref:Uncharacterized protein n=1 Tax=Ditylenchus destructor TaxID=166010 RepID=A0AAD4N9F8_9BILA|nr:hypothetical protein DdX_06633 [Ditylenchus destructor]
MSSNGTVFIPTGRHDCSEVACAENERCWRPYGIMDVEFCVPKGMDPNALDQYRAYGAYSAMEIGVAVCVVILCMLLGLLFGLLLCCCVQKKSVHRVKREAGRNEFPMAVLNKNFSGGVDRAQATTSSGFVDIQLA